MQMAYFWHVHVCVCEYTSWFLLLSNSLGFFPTQLCVQGNCIFRENCGKGEVRPPPYQCYRCKMQRFQLKLKQYLYSFRLAV